MLQTWSELLFLHWVVDSDLLKSRLPPGLSVDCFEGNAYVGLVPFFMRNIRFRGTPALPWISNFLELNVRTYVYDSAGNPGVWFFSLDCDQPLAVWAARTLFHLNYQHARMRADIIENQSIHYRSARKSANRDQNRREESSMFQYTWESETFFAEPGSLDFFLVERYLLFTVNRQGDLFRGQVHHTPYPLHRVQVPQFTTDLFELNGMPIPSSPFVHAIGSHGVDVQVYSLRSINGSQA